MSGMHLTASGTATRRLTGTGREAGDGAGGWSRHGIENLFSMRYTLPWFFCPSKRVAQTPGAAVTDHKTGLMPTRLRTARALIHALIVRTLSAARLRKIWLTYAREERGCSSPCELRPSPELMIAVTTQTACSSRQLPHRRMCRGRWQLLQLPDSTVSPSNDHRDSYRSPIRRRASCEALLRAAQL